VTTDLNTLLTALYVKIDDHLGRPVRVGRPPRLTDAELVTLAVAQALLGIRSETRWLRFLPRHLPGAFQYLPRQSGYNKRLRAAVPLLKRVIRMLAIDTDLWTDATWVVDSTPVECARSREAAKRSAGGVGRIRLLLQPLPVLLGPAPAPGLHPSRPTGHLGLGQPENRRTPSPDGDPGPRPEAATVGDRTMNC